MTQLEQRFLTLVPQYLKEIVEELKKLNKDNEHIRYTEERP